MLCYEQICSSPNNLLTDVPIDYTIYIWKIIANPAIMAAEERVQVVQGLTVGLEVYRSGYPVPTRSDITWRLPDSSIVSENDPGMTLQDSGRRLILSNVQASQAGQYTCSVTVSQNSESVGIRLEVVGEYR